MPNWKKVIVSGSNAVLNNITSSGNISASGNVYGDDLIAIGELSTVGTGVNKIEGILTLGSANIPGGGNNLRVAGTSEFTSHITASGNISASGTIYSKHIISDAAYYAGDTRVIYNTSNIIHLGDTDGGTPDNSVKILATNIGLEAPVTASGNISASGIINASQLNLSNQHYGDFNGTIFRVGSSAPSDYQNDLSVGNKVFFDASSGHITASGNISASGTVQGLTGSFSVLVGDTSQPTSLEVDGPITASGGIISTNVEILTQGSARVSSITNTTDYWGPNYQGPYHTANWNRNVTPETDGNIILTRLKANTGFIVPYKCDLVGFDAIGAMQSGEDTPFSMSLFTADAMSGMNLNSTANVADDFTASLACTGISQGSTGYNRHRITGSCTVNLTPFSVVYPLVKVDAAGDDDSAMSVDVTYVIKVKRT